VPLILKKVIYHGTLKKGANTYEVQKTD
jgi:hypothetical protein